MYINSYITYRAVRFDDLFAAESKFYVFFARARADAMAEFFVVLGGTPDRDKRPTKVCRDEYSDPFIGFVYSARFTPW